MAQGHFCVRTVQAARTCLPTRFWSRSHMDTGSLEQPQVAACLTPILADPKVGYSNLKLCQISKSTTSWTVILVAICVLGTPTIQDGGDG